MSPGDKSGFVAKVLSHFDIKNEVTLDLLVSYRDGILRFVPNLKSRPDIPHLLAYSIPP